MPDASHFIVPEETPSGRLDKILSHLCPEHSRMRLKKMIEEGQVTVNGKTCKGPAAKIRSGDKITLTLPPLEDPHPQPENIPLDIIYEDDDLLVINKSIDLVVHPGAGQADGTLVNALLYHCGDSLSGIGGIKRPGIVHRLDKETSGLMVVAKNDKAHQGLTDQLVDRSLTRIYTGFVWKVPSPIKGIIDAPIGRHKTQRVKMAAYGVSGRDARTHYHVKQSYGAAAAKIECRLETGRTHQIRVHLAHLRHPMIGDPTYGLAAQEAGVILNKAGYAPNIKERILTLPRQALHAGQIGFIHPVLEEKMHFAIEMPDDMKILENDLKSIT